MLAIFKRELKAYFFSPTGYIFIGFFLLISGFNFAYTNLLRANPIFTATLSSIIFVFFVTIPVLTMRLLTDEARQKTDQLLLTSPLGIPAIVLGKYFAAVAVFLITVAITWLYPIILSFFGTIATWEIIGAYIGFFLLGSAYIALGMFISSLTDNQVVAAITTFGVLLLFQLLSSNLLYLPSTMQSGLIFAGILVFLIALLVRNTTKNIYAGIVAFLLGGGIMAAVYFTDPTLYVGFIIKFFNWFLLSRRYTIFTMGVLSLSPIVYFISFSAFFVFLTMRIIDKKRWS